MRSPGRSSRKDPIGTSYGRPHRPVCTDSLKSHGTVSSPGKQCAQWQPGRLRKGVSHDRRTASCWIPGYYQGELFHRRSRSCATHGLRTAAGRGYTSSSRSSSTALKNFLGIGTGSPSACSALVNSLAWIAVRMPAIVPAVFTASCCGAQETVLLIYQMSHTHIVNALHIKPREDDQQWVEGPCKRFTGPRQAPCAALLTVRRWKRPPGTELAALRRFVPLRHQGLTLCPRWRRWCADLRTAAQHPHRTGTGLMSDGASRTRNSGRRPARARLCIRRRMAHFRSQLRA